MLTAATWVAAFLLALAGAAKMARPSATNSALQTAHVPSSPQLVRLIGAGEIGLGVIVAGRGGVAATATMAIAYALFAVVARRQQRAGSGCGCFGRSDAPVTSLHVGSNIAMAGVAIAAAVRPAPSLADLVTAEPLTGVVTVMLVGVGASLVRLLLTAVPELTTAVTLIEQDGGA